MKVTDSEYIEKTLEENIYTTTGLRLQPNQWLIDEIEKFIANFKEDNDPLSSEFN